MLEVHAGDALKSLSDEAQARARFLVGRRAFRKSLHATAVNALVLVPASSPDYARALYAQSVALADPGWNKNHDEEVLLMLEQLLSLEDTRQTHLEDARASAVLARGYVLYDLARYAEAAASFSQVTAPRRAEALFGLAWSLFAAGDPPRALEALHDPDLARSFVPEATLLEATIHHSGGRFDDAEASLAALERDDRAIDGLAAGVASLASTPGALHALVPTLEPRLRTRVLSNARGQRLLAFLAELDREHAALRSAPEPWAAEAASVLAQNREMVIRAIDASIRHDLELVHRESVAACSLARRVRFEIAEARPASPDERIARLRDVAAQLRPKSIAAAELNLHLAVLSIERGEHAADPRAAWLEAGRILGRLVNELPRWERHDEALFLLGELQLALGRRDQAREAFRQLVEAHPASPLAGDARLRL